MKLHSAIGLITLFMSMVLCTAAFSKETCGTPQIIKHRQDSRTSAIKLARAKSSICTADDLYDSVYTRKTPHFQIFYTLEGPHKTTPEFIDSLASSVEYAWKFHTQKLGMLPPLGMAITYHYQQITEDNLYPVEVLDIGLLRDFGNMFSGCYGITYPSDDEPNRSELVIENDFISIPTNEIIRDSINLHGESCIYNAATLEMTNITHGYSYKDEWAKGIRVTAVHELYHAVQLRYLDMNQYWTFWFEASATGIEEIAAPDIDDYIGYLPKSFSLTGTPIDKMGNDYGAGILAVYLHDFIDPRADKFIWEQFAKHPEISFQDAFEAFAKAKKLSSDSIFHDYTTRLIFSGTRSSLTDSSKLLSSDQGLWPNISVTSVESKNTPIEPQINTFAYKFYNNGIPKLDSFKGKASVILHDKDQAEIVDIPTANALDKILVNISHKSSIDSIVWVFSNFNDNETLPTIPTDPTLKAFPTPWRNGPLCFTPLPSNKEFIEIRNRRGNLITRENYIASTHCIDEARVKELMTPGVYRYRVGNSGKTKDLLIIY